MRHAAFTAGEALQAVGMQEMVAMLRRLARSMEQQPFMCFIVAFAGVMLAGALKRN